MTICLLAGQIKKKILYKINYYSEPNSHGKQIKKVELDLSNYAIKSDLKGAANKVY